MSEDQIQPYEEEVDEPCTHSDPDPPVRPIWTEGEIVSLTPTMARVPGWGRTERVWGEGGSVGELVYVNQHREMRASGVYREPRTTSSARHHVCWGCGRPIHAGTRHWVRWVESRWSMAVARECEECRT